MTHWSLEVSDETDKSLRAFLAQQEGERCDLSEFVEKAVKSKLFHMTIDTMQRRNSAFDQDEIMSIVDEAVDHVRATTPRS